MCRKDTKFQLRRIPVVRWRAYSLALFDVYNAATGLFTEHYGQIPIGLQVHFIMVSVIDGQWYYSVKGATIGANHTETFTELEPVSQEDLAQIIDDLP